MRTRIDSAKLEALLASGKDGPLLRYGLAQALVQQGKLEEALTHLAKTVELDSGFSAAWKLYGKTLSQAGRTEEAMKTYQAGIEAAEHKGDIQAAKEMRVFLRRLEKSL